ncbi:MAG: hypothetical protein FJZ64_04585 [Chlamydiae bacterium]|nr:hypothetical protein [Chlamydiota bacterium]
MDDSSKKILALLDVLIQNQKNHILKMARSIVPDVTDEDLLQPNDFPELEMHPYFRYEEGILHAFLAAKAAIQTEIAN